MRLLVKNFDIAIRTNIAYELPKSCSVLELLTYVSSFCVCLPHVFVRLQVQGLVSKNMIKYF